ncbi:hypothetical protein PIB30_091258 [Stylosanthes scabra]|uniref:Uncharacterized protein n=1 Tax=Stylosanthes scabra TaxID=79078 RepID=A0ABU6ZT52_9FABA|nr:hypothetical protein [Stylosanthes scabra]
MELNNDICFHDGTHKVKPSGQREDKSVQTSYAHLTKARIIKKRLTYQMAREGTSRVGTKPPIRRSQRITALHRAKNQVSEEHEVIELSSDSEHEKDKNLEAGAEEALPAIEDGAEETIPKNDVYAVLWAMLDAESENEAERIPGQWDLDGVLNN